MENLRESGKSKENQGKSRRIRENQGESGKIKENQGKSRRTRENQGESGKIKENQGKSRRTRNNQGTFSIFWKSVFFPEKIKEFSFLLNIYVTPTNDCT